MQEIIVLRAHVFPHHEIKGKGGWKFRCTTKATPFGIKTVLDGIDCGGGQPLGIDRIGWLDMCGAAYCFDQCIDILLQLVSAISPSVIDGIH